MFGKFYAKCNFKINNIDFVYEMNSSVDMESNNVKHWPDWETSPSTENQSINKEAIRKNIPPLQLDINKIANNRRCVNEKSPLG